MSLDALKLQQWPLLDRIRELEGQLLDQNSLKVENADMREKLCANEDEFLKIRERYYELSDRVEKFIDKEKSNQSQLQIELDVTQQKLNVLSIDHEKHLTESKKVHAELKRVHAEYERVKIENENLQISLSQSVPKVIHQRYFQLIGTLVKTVDIQRLRRELDKVKTVFKKEVNEIRSYFENVLPHILHIAREETYGIVLNMKKVLGEVNINISDSNNMKEIFRVLDRTVIELVQRVHKAENTNHTLAEDNEILGNELVSINQKLTRQNDSRNSESFVMHRLKESVDSAERHLYARKSRLLL